nr:hypothetical protein [Clostridia bacterium]
MKTTQLTGGFFVQAAPEKTAFPAFFQAIYRSDRLLTTMACFHLHIFAGYGKILSATHATIQKNG